MLLTGCETVRTLPEWQGEQLEASRTAPLRECNWPDIKDVAGGGFLDTPALSALEQCREVAEANHAIAAANAQVINKLINAANATNAQGEKYVDLAEFQLNELERDRRDAVLESWAYKGILAVVLIAVAL